MNNLKNEDAANLQQTLVDKGYKFLDFCDTEENGMNTIHHYSLSKNDEIAKPDGCLLFTQIDLQSKEALEVLEHWLNQIDIYPDPRSL